MVKVENSEKYDCNEKLICKKCKSNKMHVQLISNVKSCSPKLYLVLLSIFIICAIFVGLIAPRIANAINWIVGIMIGSWVIRRISIETNIEKYAICDECGYSYKIVD